KYMPVMAVLVCFAVLYVVGGWAMIKKCWFAGLVSGLVSGGVAYAIAYISALNAAIILTGVMSGIVSIILLLAFLKLQGAPIIDKSVLTDEEREIERSISLLKALSPWLILLGCLVIVAFVNPVDQLLRVKLAMPVTLIPGSVVNLRILWNAYFWIVASTLLSIPVLRPGKAQLREVVRIWGKRGLKPFVSAFVFFSLGYVMTYSGYQILPDGNWVLPDQLQNMLGVLAEGSARVFGSLYTLIAAPLGLFAGFITSSEASALAMFAKYNILTAEKLGMDALAITAATGVAAGIASIISPAKLQSAAATIDAQGEENNLLKQTIVIALLLTVAVVILCFLFS
ncbi:MAG: L-lactate permease, partial [Clostridiales bacterium]